MNSKPKSFYARREWRDLRYRILNKYSATCMLCNRSRADGVQIHVDHILPVSIYPELALDEKNTQILCVDCNLGKSNRYVDDFRQQQTKGVESKSEESKRKLYERFKKMGLSEIELARLKKYSSSLPDMDEGA